MNIQDEKIERILLRYKQIIEKRKATIENKRAAKILLNEQNRLKKLEKKKIENVKESKRIIRKGVSYSKEVVKSNNNIYNDEIIDYERERKEYEKNVIKPNEYDTEEVSAINNAFIIKSYKKFELLNYNSQL